MQTHIAYLSDPKARTTGVRVLEPPADTRQAVRGNLYAIVEVADTSPEQFPLIEHALSVIQRTYYSVKGTQTFVLTESLREALTLFHNGAPPSADTRSSSAPPERSTAAHPLATPGILLLSLIGKRMMMVGSGPILALITTGSNVDVYPNYPPGSQRPTNAPLDIYRTELTNGGAFLLAGQRCLQHFTLRELASIVAYVTEENLGDVAFALRSQAEPELLTGLLTVVSPDEDADSPVATQGQSAVSSTKRRGGLPAALSAIPPRRNIEQRKPPAQNAALDRVAEADNSSRVQEWGALPSKPSSRAAADAPSPSGQSRIWDTIVQRGQHLVQQAGVALGALIAPRPSPPASGEQGNGQRGSTVNSRPSQPVLSDARFPAPVMDEADEEADADYDSDDRYEQVPLDTELYHEPVVTDGPNEQFSARAALGARPLAASSEAVLATQQVPLRGVDTADYADDSSAATVGAPGRRGVVGDQLTPWQPPVAPKRATGQRARLFALIALVILLLTVVVVASVSWVTGSRNVAQAERILDMAEASFLSAQGALDGEDKATARLKLNEAQALINEATALVGTRLEKADALNARIEQELAGLLQIRPLQALAAPLVQFPPEAQPQRLVVFAQDIYVLDTGRQLVQHYEMDPTNNVVLNTEGDTVLAQGDSIDGATVGRLVDIAWMPPVAGVDDKEYLLVLDGSNNIFRYDNRVEGASRLDLGAREELRTPTELRFYAERLYLADAGTNQIYRYGRGDFATPPERWFGPQTQTDLSSLRAMAIDGDIWLLFEQGLLLRYRTGEQLQFSLESSFGQIQEPVDLAVGNQSNSLIYVADAAEDRILVFNKDGGYEHQLQAPEGDVLRNLRAISVDDVAGTMYILTQSFLFNHPLPN